MKCHKAPDNEISLGLVSSVWLVYNEMNQPTKRRTLVFVLSWSVGPRVLFRHLLGGNFPQTSELLSQDVLARSIAASKIQWSNALQSFKC